MFRVFITATSASAAACPSATNSELTLSDDSSEAEQVMSLDECSGWPWVSGFARKTCMNRIWGSVVNLAAGEGFKELLQALLNQGFPEGVLKGREKFETRPLPTLTPRGGTNRGCP